MDNDDILKGCILTRRETILLLGGSGLAFLAGCGGGGGSTLATPSTTPTTTTTPSPSSTAAPTVTPTSTNARTCVVRPELTEGPYFVDEGLNRSDVRSDPTTGTVQQGVLLNLTFNVSQLSGSACGALSGAMVDVWEANALGKYSDISSEGTSGQKFLRGYQLTSSTGTARFAAIYPGWYSGRAVHLHFKVRATIAGRSYEFTSQLFFDDALSDTVYTASPYNTRGTRNVRNGSDGIYSQSGGQTLLAVSGSNSTGYTGTFNLALNI